MEKDLKSKAIDIKGKQYVLVSDRVLYFNETYSNGCIQNKIIKWENDTITIRTTVIPDTDKPERKFIGHAQEVIGNSFINKTSALENAETSAVGRALAMLGIGVIDSIASVDEITKAVNRSKVPAVNPASKITTKDQYNSLTASSKTKVGEYYGELQGVPFVEEKELLKDILK